MSQQKNDTQDPRLQGIPILGLEDATQTLRIVCVDANGCLMVSGGGGGGTVTSVAGGVGITNSPEPITTTGTVDLDINSLTTEPTLASGDLFAFVDVSVGTSPSAQRKVTLGDIATFIGSGADCSTAPDLTCRLGRSGTANDTTLSLDGFGSLFGSDAAGPAGLNLSAATATDLGPFHFINLNPLIDSWNGTNALLGFGLYQTFFAPGAPVVITFNDEPGDPAHVIGFNAFGLWEIGDDSEGGPLSEWCIFGPQFQNPTGVAKHLSATSNVFGFSPTFLATDAACDVGILTAYASFPQFVTAAGGTLSVTNMGTLDIRYTMDAGVTLGAAYGCFYEGPVGAGTVSNDDIAFQATSDAGVTVSGERVSLEADSLRIMRHAGAAMFGTNTAPDRTNGNVIEVERTHTLTGSVGDGQAAGIVLDPGYSGAFTVTRHNYVKYEDTSVASSTVTDACVMWFDAAAGTHKALLAQSGSGTPTLGAASAPVTGEPDAWVKINVNGTVMVMPAWA